MKFFSFAVLPSLFLRDAAKLHNFREVCKGFIKKF